MPRVDTQQSHATFRGARTLAKRIAAHPILSGLTTLLAIAVILAIWLPSRFIVLNTSPSIASGFYVLNGNAPAVGQFAEFSLPAAFSNAYPHCPICRHNGALLLKPTAAGPGDFIDTTGDWLFINHQRLARIKTHDAQGRPIPVWRVHRVLEDGEFFMFSDRISDSLDSRYFGPIHRSEIRALRRPLLTW